MHKKCGPCCIYCTLWYYAGMRNHSANRYPNFTAAAIGCHTAIARDQRTQAASAAAQAAKLAPSPCEAQRYRELSKKLAQPAWLTVLGMILRGAR